MIQKNQKKVMHTYRLARRLIHLRVQRFGNIITDMIGRRKKESSGQRGILQLSANNNIKKIFKLKVVFICMDSLFIYISNMVWKNWEKNCLQICSPNHLPSLWFWTHTLSRVCILIKTIDLGSFQPWYRYLNKKFFNFYYIFVDQENI